MKILITSGGTKMPIDSVRYIGNRSTGRYGAKLAECFLNENMDQLHNHVVFFHEKGSRLPYDQLEYVKMVLSPKQIQFITYNDYWGYTKILDILEKEKFDLIFSVAAVSDYILPPNLEAKKISSDLDEMTITLKKGPKFIQRFKELQPQATIVGFKLLVNPTPEETEIAVNKQLQYVDYTIVNDYTNLKTGNQTRYLYQKNCKDPVRIESPADIVKYFQK